MMQQYKFILVYGFALFAMFFGSGNLVFPIEIGQATGVHWFLGFLGLFVTGIILPFLGLFVIKLHKGSYQEFFAEAGPIAKIGLPLFTLSLLGSFGVVPRCITVAHGGIRYLIPEIPLSIFSLLFCVVTFFFCLKDQRMINILGKWMSPILLIALILLMIMGIMGAGVLTQPGVIKPGEAFLNGFSTGYQTMDLFAAFFFSALIFAQIQKMMPETASHRDTVKFAVKPSIFGAGLLALMYLGLVFLGAYYSDIMVNIAPELMLPTIAKYIMGDNAALFIGIVMVIACLTTAVALNNVYARYLCSLGKLKNNRFPWVLLLTTVMAYLISLLDFKGISAFLAPALNISYPGIIVLTMLSIYSQKKSRFKVYAFYLISILMVMSFFYNNFW